MVWLVAIVVGGWLPGQAWASPDEDAQQAMAALRVGRPYVAFEHAARCLDADPRHLSCVRVRLLTGARTGRCDAAFADVERLRATSLWSGGLAHAEGLCALRLGQRSRARAAFEEAIALDASTWASLGQLATLLARDGDPEAERHRHTLEAEGELDVAVIAGLAGGGPHDPGRAAAVHAADAFLPPRGGLRAAFQARVCEDWLALGDPVHAAEAAQRVPHALVKHSRLAACLAEATRREGAPHHALERLDQPWWNEVDAVALDVVRVRVLIDLGRLDDAASRLRGLPPSLDGVSASAWYLAQHLDPASGSELPAPSDAHTLFPVGR